MLTKRFTSPVVIAAVLTIVFILWLLSGEDYTAQQQAPATQNSPKAQLVQVEAVWSDAKPYQARQVAQGQVLPWRTVTIKAQVAGRVEAILVAQGDNVKQGEKLLRLTDEGRRASLRQAEANMKLRQTELQSAKALKKSDFLSTTELTRLQSELAKAEAELASAELAVQHTEPAAPFAGIADRRFVESGDLVQTGTELLQLVQIDTLKVTAYIPQQHIGAVAPGQSVVVRLLDGRSLNGKVSFISAAADQSTRSFYIEVRAENPQLLRIAGGSATVEVQLPDVLAHKISPALLKLDTQGNLGLAAVNAQQQVTLYPVTVLSVGNDGAWVSGLPERVQLITQGAGFVQNGESVRVAGDSE